jgi:hypothetical protein
LEQKYKKILKLVNKEKALREGDFYDLMYANQHIGNQQYAFLRKAGREVILVVTNFSPRMVSIELTIPRHAFEHLHGEPVEVISVSLLNKDKRKLFIYPDMTIPLIIPALSGIVYNRVLPQK